MKVNIFKKLIRDIIREELDNKFSAVEKKLDEVLVSNKSSSIVEDRVSQPTASTTRKNSVYKNKAPITKDSILNDILKETANAGDWKSIENGPEVKSVTENTVGLPDHLANALNKDYSQVMKKVEEKEKFRNGA